MFDGDARRFITNELGVTFDQRNSLVVGIAMGFAVIPTIFSIAEDAVFSVPKHLSNGSLALVLHLANADQGCTTDRQPGYFLRGNDGLRPCCW